MLYGNKHRLIIILVSFLTLIITSSWIPIARAEKKELIPVLPKAEQLNNFKRKIAGSAFDFNMYVSSQSQEQIKEFYRAKLPQLGWTEKDTLQQFSQVPGFKPDPELTKFLGQNLLFGKGNLTLTINFSPSFADGKSRFSIGVGEVRKNSPMGNNMLPELMEKPKKNVAPVYPGAYLINLSESEDSLKATYISKTDIGPVASFYKSQMLNYGWILIKENPVHEIDTKSLLEKNISGACPSCAEKAKKAGAQSMGLSFGELIFSNAEGATCRIGLIQLLVSAELKDYIGTNIMVDYAQKK